MTLNARWDLVAPLRARFRRTSPKKKQHILNEFVIATGYHRKDAIRLQNRPERRGVYTPEVQDALVLVWKAANRSFWKVDWTL